MPALMKLLMDRLIEEKSEKSGIRLYRATSKGKEALETLWFSFLTKPAPKDFVESFASRGFPSPLGRLTSPASIWKRPPGSEQTEQGGSAATIGFPHLRLPEVFGPHSGQSRSPAWQPKPTHCRRQRLRSLARRSEDSRCRRVADYQTLKPTKA